MSRESILKNFKIRAIVLMGNKTFGATGTNTVVLFLEKYNEPPKKADLIEDSIDAVFNGCNLDGCVVSYEPLYGLLRRRMETYRSDTEGQPDITLDGTKEDYEKLRKQYPHLSIEECEYSCAGAEFYMKLLKHQGFMIHASAVEKEGKAYLFSAPSGTGKSTHAQLWRQTFKGEPIRIINDDKPAVCLQNGVFYACGTPFSGKTDKNENRKAPIQGLCMLHRGKTNKIQKITSGEALPLILPQTLFYGDEEETNLLLSFLDRFLQSVPVYKMECTMEEEAAKTAYFCMKGEEK